MRRCHTLAFVSGLWVNACLNRQLHIGASAMASSGNRRRMTPIARDRRPSQGSAPKRKFYAVQKGMNNFSGVVTSWDECKLYVNGVSGAKFKSFSTYEEALHFSQPTGRPNVQVIGGFQRKALSSARGVERALPQADDDASANAAEEIFDDVPFVLSEAGEPQPNAPRVITVYTDGACTGNGQRGSKAGYGVFFGEGSPYNVSEPLEGRPTNQRAEMKAALEALSVIRERGLVAKRGLVQLYTDSKVCQYISNCIR